MHKNRIQEKICLILICLAFLFVPANAQNGRWVEHSLGGFDTGTPLITRGDGCLGYTRDISDKLLIFDINVHNWLMISLETPQSFQEFTTEGQIVFAIGDNLLFGYSATTQTWDTISYAGDYMVGGEYYYGCGDSLAYFVTQSYMYVFDAGLGYWQYYDYSFTSELGYGVSWVKDDYVAIALSRDYPNQPKNVVYSGHTHSFNQLENGIGRSSPIMDHGFVGLFNIDYNNEDYKLIGYSAITNTFDVVNYSCAENEASRGGTGAGALPVDEFTVRAQTFRAIVPNESVTANFYGFDTRRGNWDHTIKNFDWTVDRYYGGWYQSGQFAFDQSLYTDDNSYHIFFYSGIDGQFRDHSPGLIYKSTTSSFGGGGTVFCVFDTLQAWGYDVAGDRGKKLDFALDKTANFERGENFLTVTRWSSESETMITYFYNGNTNQWSSVVLPEHRTTDGIKTSHMYMHCGHPENELIFYSAYQDKIVKVDFTDGLSVDYKIRDGMAFSRSEEKSVLFNGYDGLDYEFDFEFDRYGLGSHSAVFCDTANDIWYGYSTLSNSFSTLATDENPYYCRDTGYVGMVTINYISKCYAYNGLGGGWVELIPEGDHVSGLLGKKTILITRSDRVYAFDPEINPTDISDNNRNIPEKYALSQNYPNPFNPSTNISFSLPRASFVNLNVYNLLGQKVTTLFNGKLEAGYHAYTWDATNVASGIYFYRMQSHNYSVTKKMLLLK
ncbi:MAG: T9SS type A sorting domain-containing protein [candidate division Zixibacteria bacterium]|nr:T9SS type A sorting domain-containing protein [candidate division Zixibacteria bacterium]